MRLLAVVRVEDADERGQARRGDRQLAQDSSLLVPRKHVTGRSGRGDWRRGPASQSASETDCCVPLVGKRVDFYGWLVIASVSRRSQSTLATRESKVSSFRRTNRSIDLVELSA